MAYCTHIDLIRHGNTARLLSQLAGQDYGVIPTAEEVQDYFMSGTVTSADSEQGLRTIKSRVEQAIDNSSGEINGYLAMFTAMSLDITFPAETLSTANMDLALFRLFESLDDESTIKINANKWIAMFDKIATGKTAINSAEQATTATAIGSAETAGSDMVWTQEALDGY